MDNQFTAAEHKEILKIVLHWEQEFLNNKTKEGFIETVEKMREEHHSRLNGAALHFMMFQYLDKIRNLTNKLVFHGVETGMTTINLKDEEVM